jgi:hypothetical protein
MADSGRKKVHSDLDYDFTLSELSRWTDLENAFCDLFGHWRLPTCSSIVPRARKPDCGRDDLHPVKTVTESLNRARDSLVTFSRAWPAHRRTNFPLAVQPSCVHR